MESIAKLISALASLAWPLVFAVLLYKLFDPLRKLVESARARKFTIKVGGNELTMEEASEQQRAIVFDLQAKVAEMEKYASVSTPTAQVVPAETIRSHKRVLWVDDQPKNNSFLIAALEGRGAMVETALSTEEALMRVQKVSFDIVISDMGRPEGKHAGLDLTRKLKEKGIEAPVYIFCGSWAETNLRSEAVSAGVAGITSSSTTLLSMLPLG